MFEIHVGFAGSFSGGAHAGNCAGDLYPENQFGSFSLKRAGTILIRCGSRQTAMRGTLAFSSIYPRMPCFAVAGCQRYNRALSPTKLELSGERNGRIAASHDAASERT